MFVHMLRNGSLDAAVWLGHDALVDRWLTVTPVEQGERELAPAAALAAVRAVISERGASLWSFMQRRGLASPLARSELEQWGQLEAAIHRRYVIVVERERPLPAYGHEYPFTYVHGPDQPFSGNEIDDGPASSLLELDVRVIETSGSPVVGLAVELAASAGVDPAGETNAAGRLHYDDVCPGIHGLQIVDTENVRWDSATHELQELPDGALICLDLHGQPSAAAEVETNVDNCLILRRPLLRFVVPDFLRFDNESAMLVPAPWTGDRHPLAAIVHGLVALLDAPDQWLFVVGHASAPGKASRNQTLSEARADFVRTLVVNDRAAWVELARTRGSLRDVIAYLDYLGRRRGWTCSCSEPVESLGTAETKITRATVSAFQADYNSRFAGSLLVDGVCGRKTLAAIFDVMRDELARWLAKLGADIDALPLDRVAYGGCGVSLAGRTSDEAADRIIDVIVIEGIGFAPELDPIELYQSPVPRRLPFELPIEPDEWATGPFTIVSDLTPDEPAEPELYRLSSQDDAIVYERTLPDDGEVEAGELVLHFEALPTDHCYTLIVIAADGTQSVVFQDLSYAQLHSAAPQWS